MDLTWIRSRRARETVGIGLKLTNFHHASGAGPLLEECTLGLNSSLPHASNWLAIFSDEARTFSPSFERRATSQVILMLLVIEGRKACFHNLNVFSSCVV
jgi:hypothetical protein